MHTLAQPLSHIFHKHITCFQNYYLSFCTCPALHDISTFSVHVMFTSYSHDLQMIPTLFPLVCSSSCRMSYDFHVFWGRHKCRLAVATYAIQESSNHTTLCFVSLVSSACSRGANEEFNCGGQGKCITDSKIRRVDTTSVWNAQ